MIVFMLIGAVILLFSAFVDEKRYKRNRSINSRYDYHPWYGFGIFFGAFIGALLWAGSSVLYTNFSEKMPTGECHRFPIVASADDSLISGNFGIFGGSINERPVYFFYRKNGPAIRQGHISVKGTTIYQDTEPGEEHISIWKQNPACVDGWEETNEWWYRPVFWYSGLKTYQIHVSDGSVIESHRFDLE